ncbi:MAG: hypothetical protein JRE58_05225 [Deltaproteobacteria bacterium]|nr:hypothetical protein [Deltaproteobacteria bacterium]
MPKPFIPEKLPLENINWENLLTNIVKANSAVAKFDGHYDEQLIKIPTRNMLTNKPQI